jgi:hypothetical protein
VSTPSPFDVLHEHFENIGALDMSFYFIGLNFELPVIKKSKEKMLFNFFLDFQMQKILIKPISDM